MKGTSKHIYWVNERVTATAATTTKENKKKIVYLLSPLRLSCSTPSSTAWNEACTSAADFCTASPASWILTTFSLNFRFSSFSSLNIAIISLTCCPEQASMDIVHRTDTLGDAGEGIRGAGVVPCVVLLIGDVLVIGLLVVFGLAVIMLV